MQLDLTRCLLPSCVFRTWNSDKPKASVTRYFWEGSIGCGLLKLPLAIDTGGSYAGTQATGPAGITAPKTR